MTPALKTVLTTAVEVALARYAQLLRVWPVSGPLFAYRQCTSMWANGRCADVDSAPKCGGVFDDVAISLGTMLGSQVYYPEGAYWDEYSETTLPATGPGILSADTAVFVTAKQTSRCGSGGNGVIAYASHCQRASDDRPTFGRMNFCPLMLPSSVTGAGFEELVSTVMHELAHILVFSSSLFPYFRDEFGFARTPRNSWGYPTSMFYSSLLRNYVASGSTISYANERGMDCSWGTATSWAAANIPYGLDSTKSPGNCVARISTPRVKAATRAFFNCDLLEGAELENQDSASSFVQGSHWEARTLAGEFMAASSYYGAKISAITLAVFEDSGWYTAAYKNGDAWVAGKDWGYRQGCAFARDKCSSTNTGSPAHFYFGSPDISGSLCSVDRSAAAYTKTTAYPSPLPLHYQYFSSPSKGGSDSKHDYCPAVIGYSSPCQSKASPSTTYGEVAGAGSKCHVSTLNNGGSSSSATYGRCYRVTCAGNGLSYSLTAASGATATCTTDGAAVTFSGYSGAVVCGSPAALCSAGEVWVPPCSAGFGMDAAVSACLPCAEGTYSPSSGTSACLPCPSGSYQSAQGQATCAACAAGSYSASPGASSCQACPLGSFQNLTGQTACSLCAAGTFGATLGLALPSQCTACPPGTASLVLGAARASNCTPCPAGSYSALPAQGSCTQCPAGSWCSAGAAQPTPCPLGTWGAAGRSGPAGCLCFSAQCYALRYPALLSATGSADDVALRGHFATLGIGESRSACCCSAGQAIVAAAPFCSACSAGYSANGSATACAACPAGSACPLGAAAPLPCAAASSPTALGSFSSAPASSQCAPCSQGTFAAGAGSTSCTAGCGPGLYRGGSGHCLACASPPGSYCPALSEGGGALCPVGFFCAGGSATAVPCSPATACSVAGLAAQPLCYWSVRTLAGSGLTGSANGAGSAASFFWPTGISNDGSGGYYVADRSGLTVRGVSTDGTVKLVAGSGAIGSSDGVGVLASFGDPTGVAIDSHGVLYVAELWAPNVRRVTPPTYSVTTIAHGVHANSIAVDSRNLFNLYIASWASHVIYLVSQAGLVTVFAGSGVRAWADGLGAQASLANPHGIIIDPLGNLLWADAESYRVRKATPAGLVSTIAGSGTSSHSDGLGTAASFKFPLSVALWGDCLMVMDAHTVRKIDSAGAVTTIAGNSVAGWMDAWGTAAQFNTGISTLVSTSAGELAVADSNNNRIRLLTCLPCPTSYYCSSGQPVLCPVNSYCPFSSTTPTPCPPGTFSNAVGAANNSTCVVCPAGTFTSTSDTCLPGWVTAASSSYCFAAFATTLTWAGAAADCAGRAPGGTLASIRNRPEALIVQGLRGWIGLNDVAFAEKGTPCSSIHGPRWCNGGWAWQRAGVSSEYITCCQEGWGLWNSYEPNNYGGNEHCVASAGPEGLNDLPCAGTHGAEVCEAPKSVMCAACPAGASCPTGSAMAQPCAAGTFSAAGASACTPCSPGSYSTASAATCLSCAPGTYASASGSLTCTACAPGTYSPSRSLSCTFCSAGLYCPGSTGQPLPCPLGAYCPPSSAAPLLCPAGTQSAAGSADASACTPLTGTRTPSLLAGTSPSRSPSTPSASISAFPTPTRTPTRLQVGAPVASFTPSATIFTVTVVVMSVQLPLLGLTTLSSALQARFAGLLVASLPLPVGAAAAVSTVLTVLGFGASQLTVTISVPISSLPVLLRRKLQSAATSSAASADAVLTNALRNGAFATTLAASGLAPSLGYDSVDSLLQSIVQLPSRVQAPPTLSAGGGASSSAGTSNNSAAGVAALVGVILGLSLALGLSAYFCYWRICKRNAGSGSSAGVAPAAEAAPGLAVRSMHEGVAAPAPAWPPQAEGGGGDPTPIPLSAAQQQRRRVEVVIPHPGPIGIELGFGGVVQSVKAYSQGAAAGLQKGFTLIAVNGVAVEGWSLDRLGQLLASSARPLRLVCLG